ncbi:MAG: thiamine-phosphate kinase, partial [Gemmatimonadaceae bacterium]
DGLASDLDHLVTASGVSFAVQIERLPLVPGVTWQDAIISGEEYELLIAAPPLDVEEISALIGCPITEIGQVVSAQRGFTERGQPILVSRGHDHLR